MNERISVACRWAMAHFKMPQAYVLNQTLYKAESHILPTILHRHVQRLANTKTFLSTHFLLICILVMQAAKKLFKSSNQKTTFSPAQSEAFEKESCRSTVEMEDIQSSKAREQLKLTVDQFKENYERFAIKYHLSLTDNELVRSAIQNADNVIEIRDSARIFTKEISNVLRITKEKQKTSDAKWTGIVCNFMSKLYPLTRLSLRLTSAIAEVSIHFKAPNL
jgi:intracellular sulfur oxidation DsrE/DsrF family protein